MSDLIMYYVFYVFIHYILRLLGAFIIDVDFPLFYSCFCFDLCHCLYFCTLDSAYLKY